VFHVADGELRKPRHFGFIEQKEMPTTRFSGASVDRIEGPLLARARPARKITGPLIVARLPKRGDGDREPDSPAHSLIIGPKGRIQQGLAETD